MAMPSYSPADRSSALILIPAHNESAHIGEIVSGCRAQDFSVWVLDDGSNDPTALEAVMHGAKVLRRDRIEGKTSILRWALAQIPEDIQWVIFMDGDGQHQPSDLEKFWSRRNDAGLVIGNRWADVAQMPWRRRLTNRAMTWLINCLSGGHAPDTQCGFRLAQRRLLQDWLPQGKHFEFETELYLHALKLKAKIESVPLRAVYGAEKSKIFWPRDAWRFVKCLLRLKFDVRDGR